LFAWDPDRPTGDPRIEDLRQRAADAVTLTVDPGRSVEAEVVLMPE
jgi:hypothetical protein